MAISSRPGSLAGSASRKDKSFVLRRHPLRRREQPLEFVLSLNSKDSVGEIILAAGMLRGPSARELLLNAARTVMYRVSSIIFVYAGSN